jgi:hypothetical protein
MRKLGHREFVVDSHEISELVRALPGRGTAVTVVGWNNTVPSPLAHLGGYRFTAFTAKDRDFDLFGAFRGFGSEGREERDPQRPPTSGRSLGETFIVARYGATRSTQRYA